MLRPPETADLVSPIDFAHYATGGAYQRARHLQYLQQELMATLYGPWDVLVAMAPPRHGKLLANDTPVLTTKGWRTHGELMPGDYVYGLNGDPVKVLAIGNDGVADHAVHFAGGEAIVAHECHEWLVIDRRRHRKKHVLETREIREHARSASGRVQHLVPCPQPLQGSDERLPVDPYFFGVWLGDGKSSGWSICGYGEDIKHIEARLLSRNYRASWRTTHKKTGVVYLGYKGLPWRRRLGLLDGKRIPDMYLTASEPQRRELLAGLVDTDGHVCQKTGRVRIVQVAGPLVDDIISLISTFGYKASVGYAEPTLSSSGVQGRQRVATIQYSPHDGVPQGTLPRKAVVVRAVRRCRAIERVVHCEPKPGRCIEVANSDGIYLVGRQMIPTHNSEFLSRWVMAWIASVYPESRSILTSYSVDLARTHSRWVRDTTHRFSQVFGHGGINPNVSSATDWQTMQGGGLLAAGVGGGITGRGADKVFIIDDAIKNAEQAISEHVRNVQWEWFQTTAYTRLEPGSKLICLGTRWHETDLLGRILKASSEDLGLRVREVRLPAMAEPTDQTIDPIGRQTDEPLWPERWGYEALARIRDTLEPYWWNALYQQRLGSYGHNEWPSEYFYGIFANDDEWPEHIRLSATALDPSKGKNTHKGDYSAIVNTGYHGGYLWIDADVQRRPVPKMMRDLVEFNMRVRPTVTGIEGVAFQELLASDYIQAQEEAGSYRDDPELIDNTVNKELRIARLGLWLRLHRIKVKRNAGGEMLVNQLKEFPNGKHDDGCFAAGTSILMANGECKAIEQVVAGDVVETRMGPKTVLLSGCTGIRPVVRHILRCGREIVATDNHPVYHSDGYFQCIKDASEVMLCQSESIRRTLKSSSSTESSSDDIQNLKTAIIATTSSLDAQTSKWALSHCTEKSGSSTTGRFHQAITSTTLMETHRTTVSKIYSASLPQSMLHCTTKKHRRVAKQRVLAIRRGRLRLNGIDQRKGENGTQSMQKKCGVEQNQSPCSACIAGKRSTASRLCDQSTAIITADKDTILRLNLQLEHQDTACNAAQSFRRIQTQRRNTATESASKGTMLLLKRSLIVKREAIGMRPVYNLTVDGGEYLANGIVVHNCDAAEMSIRLLMSICEDLGELAGPSVTQYTL